jgi:hypothetical protein
MKLAAKIVAAAIVGSWFMAEAKKARNQINSKKRLA